MRQIHVAANQRLGGEALKAVVRERVGQGPCTITIVIPVVPDSRDVTYNVLHGSSVSYEAARTQAVRRLRPALQVLRWLGASVDGETGAEDLVKAVVRLSIVRIYENILGMAGSFPPRVVLRRGRLSARAESTHFFSLSSPVGWQSETTVRARCRNDPTSASAPRNLLAPFDRPLAEALVTSRARNDSRSGARPTTTGEHHEWQFFDISPSRHDNDRAVRRQTHEQLQTR